jgi:uncharacterized protein involved in oxidation of intracellular sulfur
MNVLIIVNDAPYGSEKAYNACRLALAMRQEHPQDAVRMFLLSDSVTSSLPNHHRPEGNYNIETMLKDAIAKGVSVKACVTCIDQRGLFGTSLIPGIEISSMIDLSHWVVDSDRVVTF